MEKNGQVRKPYMYDMTHTLCMRSFDHLKRVPTHAFILFTTDPVLAGRKDLNVK